MSLTAAHPQATQAPHFELARPEPSLVYPARRPAGLSEIGNTVYDLVSAMETALHVGGYVRVLTRMFHKAPLPTQPQRLLETMAKNTQGGWSCWDVSVALVELLRQRGISAGVTTSFGAEPGAPSEPHALVRVDDNGTSLLADPYFGVGVLAPNGTWHSDTSRASVRAPSANGGAERVQLEHRTYTRRYGYHILPGVLTSEQLTAMTWQALEYGELVPHLRGVGNGTAWRLIRDISSDTYQAELRSWGLDIRHAEPPLVVHGNFFEMCDFLLADRATERENALQFLFGTGSTAAG